MAKTARRPSTRPRRRPAPSDSHSRILDAAIREFAARGFAGARVDRIAAAARLNKAMLYYHFGSKAGLYRAAIQLRLGALADHLESVASSSRPAFERLDDYIATFIRLGLQHPEFAPIMLREVAEGAARIDHDTVRYMTRIVGSMAAIVHAGTAEGAFRDVNPLLAYLGTAWPIMIYLASGPVREVIHKHSKLDTSALAPELFIRHMQDVGRRSLAAEPTQALPRRNATTERAS